MVEEGAGERREGPDRHGGHGVALVTGAGSGIGAAIARRLGEDGYAVAVNDIRPDAAATVAAELASEGVEAWSAVGDVSDEAAVERIVESIVSKRGTIEVLVNNAGVGDRMGPTEERDVDLWQRVLDVNLRSAFLCSRRAGREMVAAGGGRIVNIASVHGLLGVPERAAYGPAKAALINLTMVLATEWARSGVRVNAVAPGYVSTPMYEEWIAGDAALDERIRARTPTGEPVTAAAVADAVSFLASKSAEHVNGVVLPVDGGLSGSLAIDATGTSPRLKT